MTSNKIFNYKTESNRYNYYYRRLRVFYQKPAVKVSSAVLFTLTTIIFFALFAIRPTLVTIAELIKKIDTQKEILQKAEKKVASLNTAQQLYNQISDELYILDQVIPSNYQIPELLLSLEATAAKLGISVSNLSISEVKYPIGVTQPGSLQQMEFIISFYSNYPDAKTFISNIIQLPRLISIDSISFANENSNSQAADIASPIKVSLNCHALYLPGKIK